MYFSNKITLMVLLKALLEISDLNKVFNFKFIFLPRFIYIMLVTETNGEL